MHAPNRELSWKTPIERKNLNIPKPLGIWKHQYNLEELSALKGKSVEIAQQLLAQNRPHSIDIL